MKKLKLHQIINYINGELVKGNSNAMITNVTYKERYISDHTLYFLEKSSIPANNYKDLVIVTDTPDWVVKAVHNACIVKVNDVSEAYWKFIDYYRNLFQIPIVGITGTCGKTTTKEMLKHILSPDHEVQATYRSLNGLQRNLPYLLGIDEQTDVGIFEMGVSSPDDLIDSIDYFRPQIRLLLNIGVHHLTGCKNPETYIKAKEKILYNWNDDGVLITNADDLTIAKIDLRTVNKIVYFGFNKRADFRALSYEQGIDGILFGVNYKEHYYEIRIKAHGKHNIYNALAAMAAAVQLGLDLKYVCNRLETYQPLPEHCEIRSGEGGCKVIDDTWNNSPLSMASALDVLQQVSGSGAKVALLGYMPRLGTSEHAIEQYKELAKKVIEAGVDLLIVAGKDIHMLGIETIQLGMDQQQVLFTDNPKEIYEKIKGLLKPDTTILLKITHREMIKPEFQELKQRLMRG